MVKDIHIATITNLAAMLGQCQEDKEDTEETLESTSSDLQQAQRSLRQRAHELEDVEAQLVAQRREIDTLRQERRDSQLHLQQARQARQYRLMMKLVQPENHIMYDNLFNHLTSVGQREWEHGGATFNLVTEVRAITHWGLVECKTFVQDYFEQDVIRDAELTDEGPRVLINPRITPPPPNHPHGGQPPTLEDDDEVDPVHVDMGGVGWERAPVDEGPSRTYLNDPTLGDPDQSSLTQGVSAVSGGDTAYVNRHADGSPVGEGS